MIEKMNKKGRKYDREKWGWKSEDEVNKHCHYSGLPSPSSYDDSHSYYESDRKLKTEKFATQTIGVCIVVMLILIVLSFIL
jgi:hypothetical protein